MQEYANRLGVSVSATSRKAHAHDAGPACGGAFIANGNQQKASDAETQDSGTPRPVNAPPRFAVGQAVRAKKINPIGHTRLPRYARGNAGVVDRIHGAHVFPDSNAHFRGEGPQHLYSVRFSARELWGEAASARNAVYIDLWEDYLETA